MPSITRLGAPEGHTITLPGPPPKTTFGGSQSREGRRISEYMEAIEPAVAPLLAAGEERLGLRLDIGLPPETDLLTHNDLDNYLEPLATFFGRGRLVGAWARKSHGFSSTLTVGAATSATRELDGWQHATASAAGLSEHGKRDLGQQVAQQAQPMPWGPVELELALRVSSRERWIRAWKPAIDSLVGILGRLPRKGEFDIEDGRIVSLALHCEVDGSLVHGVELEAWWRAADEPASYASPSAPLVYVGGPPATDQVPTRKPPSLPRRGRRRPRVPESELAGLGVGLIIDVAQFRAFRAAAAGFVVITDHSNPIRLHRAGCPVLKEENFERKVIQNAMKTGEYFGVSDADVARRLWPGIAGHTCV